MDDGGLGLHLLTHDDILFVFAQAMTSVADLARSTGLLSQHSRDLALSRHLGGADAAKACVFVYRLG